MRTQDLATGMAAVVIVALGGTGFYRGLTGVERPAPHHAPAIASAPAPSAPVTIQAAEATLPSPAPAALVADAEPSAGARPVSFSRPLKRVRQAVAADQQVEDAVYERAASQAGDPVAPGATDSSGPAFETRDADAETAPPYRDDPTR